VDHFGPDGVIVLPNVTTVQCAAARIKIPWQDVVAVSLHGRSDYAPLYAALLKRDWVAAFTDPTSIPAAIAQSLVDKGVGDRYLLWVFEDMGTDDERFERFSLAEASQRTFSHLSLVLFERVRGADSPLTLGIPDEKFATDKGLITKWPVRAAALAALRITPDSVVWDLGAGSGAVAIEASTLAHNGRVLVVEKNPGRVADIRENIRRFGALSVDVFYGVMPAALADLPDPDRIFIGGGLGKDVDVLREACRRLAPGGRIVISCVLLGTLLRVKEYLAAQGWPFEVTLAGGGVSTELAGDVRIEGLNPVFLVSAEKAV
jgi:precorrin-6Y C5,15-methyltransferase (decarboxylating)